MVTIKGYDFNEVTIRNSYNRRATQYRNKIITSLKVFELTEDDVEIPLEGMAMRKASASASWYMWNEHLFYSYNGSAKFVENLAMVAQVIEHFIYLLANEHITQEEFLGEFVEKEDILKERKEARELLGIEEDSIDFEKINKNYKELSKKYHPDMSEGDIEMFKKINNAHKVLKKELC